MKTRNEDILYFSSDKLAALGLESLLSTLPCAGQIHELWSLSTVIAQCEKLKPRLLVCIFHENMPLAGTLKVLYALQQQFPAMQMLVLTRRLLPLMHALSRYLPSLTVLDLKSSRQMLSSRLLTSINTHAQVQLLEGADIILPDRQLRVLLMMAWGYSMEHIGIRLGISHKTVNAHKLNALTRLQIKSKNDMADLFMVIDELRMLVSWLRLQGNGKLSELNFYSLEELLEA
ncbi:MULTISPECIES: LuxR C-terminal-related transcriptional regulator [Enterobacterales]|jgi:DNA-binding NarL/FixJ family response regulator|uniref:DNA-binding response regulator, NarL/FixJ family, contains REC and HTH domains n=1 Tax=Candidatus Pantoea symbiotica TaxID=1884370 RepID=A0A1I4DE62_9GAMM|nr:MULTISPECIES: LuxR C-terminal-related transcriptional regulator [Enterobacterales]MRS21897.1 DNA-binding response regulator [Enterobacteriaceae bacterium RIT692]MRT26137.1 DNA-binding response regulator [Enterobacteriaceae bacterium RIT697]MRT43932.1 DNA-binding response regulator [Enterobacteriaceae bacterium RIT702]KAJ9431274.1 LuxR C-terminal-related transcriptional regulator [Pantoea sp. YR343]MBB3308051.1 DNA-binding NarL/FixJ family response regulator [Enterobacter sp. Sphag1F]